MRFITLWSSVAVLVCALGGLGTTDAQANANWLRFEGMGNFAKQDNPSGGHQFGGGLRYTPHFTAGSAFEFKPIIGGQMFKGTDKKRYAIVEYAFALQFRNLAPWFLEFGAGGGTAFRTETKTRALILGGIAYELSQPIFGLIDQLVLTGHYVFNSSDLYYITYGASASF